MARIRTIKPAFFASLSNANLPIPTRLTWVGLWTYVDDKGRGVDDARLVKAAVWPLDEAYTSKKVEADLVLLEKAGKIGRYIHDGERFFAVVKWRDHQRIDKPQPSTLPAAPWEEGHGYGSRTPPPAPLQPDSKNGTGTFHEDSGNDPGMLQEDDGNDPGAMPPKDGGEVEGKGREGKGSSSSAGRRERSWNDPDDDDFLKSGTEQALALIADRRIAAAAENGAIQNPGGYRRKVMAELRIEMWGEVEMHVCKGLSTEAIADRMAPAKIKPPSPHVDFEEHRPAWSEDDVSTDEHGGNLVVMPRRVG